MARIIPALVIGCAVICCSGTDDGAVDTVPALDTSPCDMIESTQQDAAADVAMEDSEIHDTAQFDDGLAVQDGTIDVTEDGDAADPACNPSGTLPINLGPGEPGPTSGSIYWITAHPKQPSLLYVPSSSTIYASKDGGASYEDLFIDAVFNGTGPLAVDPNDGKVLYAVLSYFGTSSLHKSIDGGATWEALAFPDGVFLQCITVDPEDSQVVYAGTHWDGVFKSVDGGVTWNQTGQTVGIIQEILIARHGPQHIYAAAYGNKGLYMSTDGGATWTTDDSLGTTIQDIALDPSNPGRVYVLIFKSFQDFDTLYRSDDDGQTWEEVHKGEVGMTRFYAFFVDPCHPDHLYLGTRHGVLRSHDGGASWTHSMEGFEASANVVTTAFAWTPGRLLVGTEYCGLYETLDAGATYHHVAGLFCDNAPSFD